MKMERFRICRTLGGGIRSYGVEDVLSNSPWSKMFNLTLLEAEKEVRKLNEEKGWKLSWWDRLFHSEESIKNVKEALKHEYLREKE